MFLSPRQTRIVALAKERGRVLVEDLALDFAVSPQTIRTDLNDLCGQRLLTRIHGGALHPSGSENLEYEARRRIAAAEKEAIGQAAARIIPDRASLFINIGTTTEAVSRALLEHDGLLVITNNINVANRMRVYPRIEVIIAGGVVRGSDGGIVGEAAVDFIEQFKVDFAVIGTSAIDRDGSLLDFDLREVKVAQAILANAHHAILVADSSKFERTAPVRIAHLSMVHTFITDRCPPSIRAMCADAGIRLIEAGPTS
jgi:DeoR family glycerol-3-phosphate regulon repressor